MSCKKENKTILNEEYTCKQWPATEGLAMQMKLIEYAGGSFLNVFTAVRGDIGDALKGEADIDVEKMTKAVSSLFSGRDAIDVSNFIIDYILQADLMVGREEFKRHHINANFSGDNLMHLYVLFWFVITTNYANFFSGQQLSLD